MIEFKINNPSITTQDLAKYFGVTQGGENGLWREDNLVGVLSRKNSGYQVFLIEGPETGWLHTKARDHPDLEEGRSGVMVKIREL